MTPPAERRFMRLALAEARRAEGRTRPNPPVGAVIVRDGVLLASGYHRGAGLPHAEIEALRALVGSAAGSTMYVTLEPCSTAGRTPPCTDAIIAAGVERVVIGVPDPNPVHAGRGVDILRAAGVDASTGTLEEECAELIAPFSSLMLRGRPLIELKMAQSLDGAIADHAGRSQWITSEKARHQVQLLRLRADAVMVGVGTVLADDPSLLCRLPDAPDSLFRVILDSRGRTPLAARVLNDGRASRTVLATTGQCPASVAAAWRAKGARVWTLPSAAGGGLCLASLVKRAGEEGWLRVFCEGGATLAGALVAENLVDVLQLMVAPVILGRRRSSAFGDRPFDLGSAPRFKFSAGRRLGPDFWLTGVREGAQVT